MPKRSATRKPAAIHKKSTSPLKASAWQTKWPKNDEIVAWLRCGIECSRAIKDVRNGAEAAQSPIQNLAEHGHGAEALKHVEHFLKVLPKAEYNALSRMGELGALVCLISDDLEGCEKYLTMTAGYDALVTRKSDKGVCTKRVHEFKVRHGLLNPADATSDEERVVASFNCEHRGFRLAERGQDNASARKHLIAMHQLCESVTGWRKRQWLNTVITHAYELSDAKLVKQFAKSVPANDRGEVLGFDLLGKIGMKQDAIAAATAELKSSLSMLKTMTDPNIHMPIQSITRALQCLININERKEAIAWLEKVTRSAKQWKCVIQGWATAAVLTAFVPIADALEGKQSAKDLAALAQKHAAKEPQSGFRQGAAGMAMQTQSELGEIDAAIAEALKIRSPAARRHQLAILYAKAKRWSDLHAICKQIDDPKDAAHTAWWVKFELPGGDHRVLV